MSTMLIRSVSDSELFTSSSSFDDDLINDTDDSITNGIDNQFNNLNKLQKQQSNIYNSWPQSLQESFYMDDSVNFDNFVNNDDNYSMIINHNNNNHMPPNYHQICIADLISLNNFKQQQQQQQNKDTLSISSQPFTKKSNNDSTLLKRMNNDIDSIRRENFLLTSIILKNNDDIKSIQSKQKRLQQSIDEISKDYRKYEKKSMDIDEKLQLNMKEIRLIHDDFEQLKRIVQKLQHKMSIVNSNNTSSTNESLPTSPINLSPNINCDMMSMSPISPLASCSSSSSSMKYANYFHNGDGNDLNRRIEMIENKLEKLIKQNNNLTIEFDRTVRSMHNNENELNTNVYQRLQYITDMNQLLQLKFNMLESKFIEQSTANNNNALSLMRMNSLNTEYNDSYDYQAQKLAYDKLSTSTLSSLIFSNDPSNNKLMTNQQSMNKNIAYVMPNIRSASAIPLQQHQQSQYLQPSTSSTLSSSMIQRSLSATEANNQTINEQQQPQTQQLQEQHHSRRCRKHHRIKLFSNNRRRH